MTTIVIRATKERTKEEAGWGGAAASRVLCAVQGGVEINGSVSAQRTALQAIYLHLQLLQGQAEFRGIADVGELTHSVPEARDPDRWDVELGEVLWKRVLEGAHVAVR